MIPLSSVSSCSVTNSCPTLCNTMDCSPPVSSVHGIPQARIWNGLPSPSLGVFPTPGFNQVFCTAGRFLTIWAAREASGSSFQTMQMDLSQLKTGRWAVCFFCSLCTEPRADSHSEHLYQLTTSSLFALVLWVSWTQASLAFRARCFGCLTLWWES